MEADEQRSQLRNEKQQLEAIVESAQLKCMEIKSKNEELQQLIVNQNQQIDVTGQELEEKKVQIQALQQGMSELDAVRPPWGKYTKF